MKSTARLVVLFFFVATLTLQSSGAQVHAEYSVQSRPLADVVQEVIGSVVLIQTEAGLGSGFYVTPQGDIVTARHVVTGPDGSAAKNIELVMSVAAQKFAGNVSVLGVKNNVPLHIASEDREHDIAVLKPEVNPFIAAATFANINGTPMFTVGHPAALCTRGLSLRAGDPIFTIGHPLGDSRAVTTRGIVASTVPLFFDQDGNPNLTYFVDMAINLGNSGGPVFTSTGCVIGLADTVELSPVEGSIQGGPAFQGATTTAIGPDGKAVMVNGKPVSVALLSSSGLGFLISQEYIFKMLDKAGYHSSKPIQSSSSNKK